MSERTDVTRGQRRLAMVWLTGAGILLLLMIVQTMFGRYGPQASRAWSWLLPTVLPTLSLIVGAVAYEARRQPASATVDRFAYRVALWLSVAYLALVLVTQLMQPVTGLSPLAMMDLSSLWLGPVQGLVGIALGVFFVSRETGSAG
jgi:hypothetical protein